LENEREIQPEEEKKQDHDAFLGKDLAKEYEELTPEKSKERLGYALNLPIVFENILKRVKTFFGCVYF
jgi:hypothetical protein